MLLLLLLMLLLFYAYFSNTTINQTKQSNKPSTKSNLTQYKVNVVTFKPSDSWSWQGVESTAKTNVLSLNYRSVFQTHNDFRGR